MERRMLIVAAAASSLMHLAEERRYSMSERVQIDDDDVFDRIFGDRNHDYVVSYRHEHEPLYGRIDREDLKITPELFLADRPTPDYGSLRAQIGGRVPGPQVRNHRRPVRRHS